MLAFASTYCTSSNFFNSCWTSLSFGLLWLTHGATVVFLISSLSFIIWGILCIKYMCIFMYKKKEEKTTTTNREQQQQQRECWLKINKKDLWYSFFFSPWNTRKIVLHKSAHVLPYYGFWPTADLQGLGIGASAGMGSCKTRPILWYLWCLS